MSLGRIRYNHYNVFMMALVFLERLTELHTNKVDLFKQLKMQFTKVRNDVYRTSLNGYEDDIGPKLKCAV